MIAEIEVIVRAPEQAEKYVVGRLVGGSEQRDLHRILGRRSSKELVARTIIDWAAGFADLEVDVRGSVEAETEEL